MLGIMRRRDREEEEHEEEVVFADEGGVRLRIRRWDAEEMILEKTKLPVT